MLDHKDLRLLLVDDEPALVRAYKSMFESHGATVDTAHNGQEGSARVKSGVYDVVVSDISMPEMTGIEFLSAIRAHDVDVPVILMTGNPELESAVRAVEYGAFRYLIKPVPNQALWDTVLRASKFQKLARARRQVSELGQEGRRLGERAALEVRFAASESRMWMAFQPIVLWSERRVFGYEALVRSGEPLMQSPDDILDAAERLGLIRQLGRRVRTLVAAAAVDAPPEVKLFVNLHSEELNDVELYRAEAPLSKIADRVILEVTERASLYGVKNIATRVARLSELGFQIAIDDLGAGYAGLNSFTQLEPALAKLDMSLVRGIEKDPRRQSIVRAMRELCAELRIAVVAEGIETPAERDALVGLGCDLLQGYLFAKPSPGFEIPRW